MNYIGEKCAACDKVITEDDDIVVCPDCGSPHHRECYTKNGKCANEAYHTEGKKWKRAVLKDSEKAFTVCPVCHFPNEKTAEKCVRCGNDIDPFAKENVDTETEETDDVSNIFEEGAANALPYFGFDPNEDLGGATVKEISDFVQTNTIYYLPIFKRMKEFGSKLSFNLICLLFPALYFANRKMWGWAVLAMIMGVIFNIPSALLYMSEVPDIPVIMAETIEANLTFINNADVIMNAVNIFVKLMFCLFGNSLYFNYILRSLKKIKNNGETVTAQSVSAMGGIKPVNMIIIVLIQFAVAAGVFMFISYFCEISTILKDFS